MRPSFSVAQKLPMRIRLFLTCLAVAASLIVITIYWPGHAGGFIFDDFPNLVDDPDWKVTDLDPAHWWHAASNGISSSLGRPLAMLSFAINHYFTGLDTEALKLTNIVFHALNTTLVLLLCFSLIRLAIDNPSDDRYVAWVALFCALAWAIHPLQVSTVLYVIQRMEIGAHTGVFIALLCYLKARQQQIEGRRAWPWFTITICATLMGLGFKETAALLPVYTLTIEVCLLKFQSNRNQNARGLIFFYVACFTGASAIFLIQVLPSSLADWAYATRDFTLSQRLLTQPRVLMMYLGQIILPLPNQLLFYYDNFSISTSMFSPPSTFWSALTLALLVFVGLQLRRRRPLISLGLGWFIGAHLLTSNVIPLELAFEHRNYFGTLGILLAGTSAFQEVINRLNKDAQLGIGIACLLFLSAVCLLQVRTWSDPFRLASSLASRNPDSVRANYSLGIHLLDLSQGNPSSPAYHLAISQFEHAHDLPSSTPLPEQALLIMNARAKTHSSPELWRRLREKLLMRRAGAQEISTLHALLECRSDPNCMIDDQQLLETFLTAVSNNPHSAVIHSQYANFAFNFMGDQNLGINLMEKAVALAPDDVQFKVNLARLLASSAADDVRLKRLSNEIQKQDKSGKLQSEIDSGFMPIDCPTPTNRNGSCSNKIR